MAQQYYVRQPNSDTARGPYSVDKLQGLAEADQIQPETLYFDEAQDDWVAIETNDALKAQVFPEKKRLTLRQKAEKSAAVDDSEASGEPRKRISVTDMLAAAEGDTAETRHVRRLERQRSHAAALSIPVIGTLLLISALSNLLPAIPVIESVIEESDPFLLLTRPLAIVGLLDLFFAVCVFLAATEIFPVLRLRAALGLGYFAFFYWSHYQNTGNPYDLFAAVSTVAACTGIFICTLTLNLFMLVTCAAVGLAGAAGFAYFTYLGPVFFTGG